MSILGSPVSFNNQNKYNTYNECVKKLQSQVKSLEEQLKSSQKKVDEYKSRETHLMNHISKINENSITKNEYSRSKSPRRDFSVTEVSTNEFREALSENVKLKNENQQLLVENQHLSKRLELKSAKNQKLLSSYKKAKTKIGDLFSYCQGIVNENEMLKREKEDLLKMDKKKDTTIMDLTNKCQHLGTSNHEQISQNEVIKNKYQEAKTYIHDVNQTVRELKNTNNEQGDRIKSLNDRVSSLENEKKALSSQIIEMSTRLADAENESHDIAIENKHLLNKIDHYMSTIQQLEEELKSKEFDQLNISSSLIEIDSLKTQLNSSSDEIQKLSQTRKKLMKTIKNMKIRIDNIENENNTIVSGLNSNIGELEERNAILIQEIVEKDSVISQLQASIEKLPKEEMISQLHNQIRKKETKIFELQNKVQEISKSNFLMKAQFETEKQGFMYEIAEYENQLSEANKSTNTLQTENSDLKLQLEGYNPSEQQDMYTNATIDHLQMENQKIAQENMIKIDDLRQQIKILEEENLQIISKNEKLQSIYGINPHLTINQELELLEKESRELTSKLGITLDLKSKNDKRFDVIAFSEDIERMRNESRRLSLFVSKESILEQNIELLSENESLISNNSLLVSKLQKTNDTVNELNQKLGIMSHQLNNRELENQMLQKTIQSKMNAPIKEDSSRIIEEKRNKTGLSQMITICQTGISDSDSDSSTNDSLNEQLNELKCQNHKLQKRIQEQQLIIDGNEKSLQTTLQHVKTIEEENMKLNHFMKTHQDDNETFDESQDLLILDLQKQVDFLKNEKENAIQTIADLEEEIIQIKSQNIDDETLQDINDQLNELKCQNHKLQKRIQEQQLIIDGNEKSLQTTLQHVKTIEEENMKLNHFMKTHQDDNETFDESQDLLILDLQKQVDFLKNEKENAIQTIADLEEEIIQIKSQNIDDETLQDINDQLYDFKCQNHKLQKRIQEQQLIIDGNEKSLQTTLQYVKTIEEENMKLNHFMKSHQADSPHDPDLQNQIIDLNDQLDYYISEYEKLKSEFGEIEEELNGCKSMNKSLMRTIEDQENINLHQVKYRDDIEKYQNENMMLKNQNKELGERIESLMEPINQIEEVGLQNKCLQKELNEYKVKCKELQEIIDSSISIDKEYLRLKSEHEELVIQCEKMRDDIVYNEELNANLKQECDKFQFALTAEKNKSDTLYSQNAEKESELSQLQSDKEEMNNSIKDLQFKLAEIQKNYRILSATNVELSHKQEFFSEKTDEYYDKFVQSNNELSELKNEYESLKEKNEELEKRIIVLDTQNSTKSSKIREMKKNETQNKQILEGYISDLNNQNHELNEANEKIKAMKKSLGQTKEFQDFFQSNEEKRNEDDKILKINLLQAENQNLSEQIKGLKTSNDILRNKLEQTMTELNRKSMVGTNNDDDFPF